MTRCALTDVHSIVRRALDVSRDLLILFIASGGLALLGVFLRDETLGRALAARRARKDERCRRARPICGSRCCRRRSSRISCSTRWRRFARSCATDPQRASQTIDALAQHLRATLPKLRAATGAAQSTLGEQFAICASYLELMKLRLGERLRVDIRLPPELHDVAVPAVAADLAGRERHQARRRAEARRDARRAGCARRAGHGSTGNSKCRSKTTARA